MQNILLLIARFGTHIAFALLQVLCFVLIVNYNKGHRETFIHSSNHYAGILDRRVSTWTSYLSLEEVNDSLAQHNASLMELFINTKTPVNKMEDDSLQYNITPARIIRNTYHLRNNHLTLDKGASDGIRKDMGVISENGILGIVKHVSPHLCVVLSVLNSQTRISCTVKPYSYPGNLVWNDYDPRHMTLESIPKHVNISVGDTIVTNGYSTIFPTDIIVGTIESFQVDGGSSEYEIKVKLVNNIHRTKVAYIIDNRLADEQKTLEAIEDEQ